MIGMLGGRRRSEPATVRDHRALQISGLVVLIIAGLQILRELFIPEARPVFGGNLVEGSAAHVHLVRPIGLVIEMVCELAAINALSHLLDRRGWRPVWHVVATVGLGIVIGTAYMLALRIALHLGAPITRALLAGPLSGIEVYALWLLAFRYPKIVDDARVRAFEADRLRRAAELSRLREHLQPHFLRNTLNAIAAFVTEDPDAARALLAALGDLLSDSLEDDAVTQTLGEETAWLRRYSEIFEARHRGTLRFAWELDPAASAIQLPRLLLQPLVENAIHHGALAKPDGGEVRVQTRRTAAGVVVVVEDDGPGIDAGRPERMGLHLVRSRLAIECPGSRFQIESSASGTRAIVELREGLS